MRNAQSRRNISRIVDVAARAAGALAVRGFPVIIKLHRDAHDVVALLLQQSGDDAGVDAADMATTTRVSRGEEGCGA